MATSTCSSITTIDPSLATERKNIFAVAKLGDLKGCTPSRKCEKTLPISVGNFLLLLIRFRDAVDAKGKKIYGGMNVYFAAFSDTAGSPSVPADREGQLTVLFAPTFATSSPMTANEDQSQYYHLFGETGLTPLPEPNPSHPEPGDIVTNWKNNFTYNRIPHLETCGNNHTGSPFVETKQLWYGMDTIAGSSTDIGLIGMIECLLQDRINPITGMQISFACFIEKESLPNIFPNYQLSITFESIQANDNPKPLFGSQHLTKILGKDSDTGIPCPPNGSC